MKKLLKSFTFWCLVISILEILMHQIGQDSKSIMLIRFNPLLRMIADSQGSLYNLMDSGRQVSCNTVTGQISVYWYFGSAITFVFYGVVLDEIKMVSHKIKKMK